MPKLESILGYSFVATGFVVLLLSGAHHRSFAFIALGVLLVAAVADVGSGTIPLWMMLLSFGAALVDHHSWWGLLWGVPPALIAWRTHEGAFGYGDAIALASIGLVLPEPLGAAITIGIAAAAALLAKSITRVHAVRFVPYLAAAGAIGFAATQRFF